MAGRVCMSLCLTGLASALVFAASSTAIAQAPPGGANAVAVQLQKYEGRGTITEISGAQFTMLDAAGRQLLVSASQQRIYNGVSYGQLDPLTVRIRGFFEGERLQQGMTVAFPAKMSGRRVVAPIERVTILTLDAARQPGVYDPISLPEGLIFGVLTGATADYPAPPAESSDPASDAASTVSMPSTDEPAPPRRNRRGDEPSDDDASGAVEKIVIGRIVKMVGKDRLSVAAGEKIEVGATLHERVYAFTDSTSATDLRKDDVVKVDGALIGGDSMFAVNIEVDRPVPPAALEGAKPREDPAKTASTSPPKTAPAPAAPGPKPPAPVAGAIVPGSPGRVVEVN